MEIWRQDRVMERHDRAIRGPDMHHAGKRDRLER